VVVLPVLLKVNVFISQQALINHEVAILENVNITFLTDVSFFKNYLTVSTAISAALRFGNMNTPVEMQQNAMFSR